MAEPRARACFCLSKARDDGARSNDAIHDLPMLRAELAGLKPGALRKRANAAGVAAEAIEEAFDAEDTKEALLELILAHDGGGEDPTSALLRGELEGLKFSALAERAKAAGVVYSLAYGDQPALICEMVDWARAAGFEVVAAGKGTKGPWGGGARVEEGGGYQAARERMIAAGITPVELGR